MSLTDDDEVNESMLLLLIALQFVEQDNNKVEQQP